MRAPRTDRAYRSDWADFRRWCTERHEVALPARPDAVAAYIDELTRTRRVTTAQRRLAAIRAEHLDAGHTPPTGDPVVAAVITQAHWRQRADVTATTPLHVRELRAMSRALTDSSAGSRDRALLLVGYGAALRPAELVQLQADDITLVPAGLRVRVARGRVVVPFGSAPELCAVRAWKDWRAVATIDGGPAFRAVDRHGRIGTEQLGEKAVTRVIRRAAAAADLPGAQYTGLSLCRGTVQAAAAHGTSDRGIMAQTGHRSRRLVRRYVEESAPGD